MPGDSRSADPRETILKYQQIMQKYNTLKISFAHLAINAKAFVDQPGVPPAVVKDFQYHLGLLKKAHDEMFARLCSEMMEELIPIGYEAMGIDFEKCRANECEDCMTRESGEKE